MSERYTVKGKIKLIGETQSFNSGFTKREFVVTDQDEKYPQDIKFEAIKDACGTLDAFGVGDEVEVSFNIRGNEYNGRHYVNLQAWKTVKVGGGEGGRKSRDYDLKPAEPDNADDIPF